MARLKNDKFVQVKQRIETDEEGHVVKMNCYFINYRTFVNVVKYKLDHMRKKMETSERDQTSRASFKCLNCEKKFTDLEANQLLDFTTGEMRCTYCSGTVDEDEASEPKKDSRMQLAKFNLEMKPLYELLHNVESVRLAIYLLEPEPVEIEALLKNGESKSSKPKVPGDQQPDNWSGGKWADQKGGFKNEDQKVEISIGDENIETKKKANAQPAWMLQSAVQSTEDTNPVETMDEDDEFANGTKKNVSSNPSTQSFADDDEIQSLLLRHEKKSSSTGGVLTQKIHIPGAESDDQSDKSESDSDFEDTDKKKAPGNVPMFGNNDNNDEIMSSGDDDGDIPTVKVGNEEYAITDIDETITAKMTPEEKDRYIQIYQDFYANVYD